MPAQKISWWFTNQRRTGATFDGTEQWVGAHGANGFGSNLNDLLVWLQSQLIIPKFKIVVAGDFTGDDITSSSIRALLIGKTAVDDFNIFSNEGQGSLLKFNDVYTFVSGTGTITIPGGGGGNYLILLVK